MSKIIQSLIVLALSLVATSAMTAETWRRFETENFIVYSNAKENVAHDYVVQLEQYRYILTAYFGIEGTASPQKTEIYHLRGSGLLTEVWPTANPNVAGFMSTCPNGTLAVALDLGDSGVASKAISQRKENYSQIVIFHEYAHDFMWRNSGIRYPPWYVEGFAEFFSTIVFEGDQMIIGLGSSMRSDWLGDPRAWLDFGKMLRHDDTLLKRRYASAFFYAQSWLLTHYILSDPQKHERFDAYIEAYNAGADPVTAFEEIMGIKVSDLDKILKTYLYKKELKATIYRIHDLPAVAVQVTVMPASSDKLLLWDAAVRICPKSKDADKLITKIRRAAQKFPNDAYAQTVLARAESMIGDKGAATNLLLTYTEKNPDDAEGWYLLGRALYAATTEDVILANETAQSQMLKSRQALTTAYKLDANDPHTLYYLSLAQNDRSDFPNSTAVNAALQAYNLETSVPEFAGRAAYVLILSDRKAEARQVLLPLTLSSHKSKATRWASQIVSAIDEGKTDEYVLGLLSKSHHDVPDKPEKDED